MKSFRWCIFVVT